jgi:hypothetical protein
LDLHSDVCQSVYRFNLISTTTVTIGILLSPFASSHDYLIPREQSSLVCSAPASRSRVAYAHCASALHRFDQGPEPQTHQGSQRTTTSIPPPRHRTWTTRPDQDQYIDLLFQLVNGGWRPLVRLYIPSWTSPSDSLSPYILLADQSNSYRWIPLYRLCYMPTAFFSPRLPPFSSIIGAPRPFPQIQLWQLLPFIVLFSPPSVPYRT